MSPKRPSRKDRRRAKHAAAAQVLPPEGVPLHLPIASVGVRIGAQITDVMITLAAMLALVLFLGVTGLLGIQSLSGVMMLLFFFTRIPYYVITELIWNGQTLGKKLMKIKVTSHDGGPLTAHAIVIRNLMKEAEVFLPGTLLLGLSEVGLITFWISFAWVVMALTIPLSNVYRQRLGDMLAGTHVVHLPVPILLKDLATDTAHFGPTPKEPFTFLTHQLDHYGAFELQTLETLLRAQDRRMDQHAHDRNRATVVSIVEKIRLKIGYADVVKSEDAVDFLRAFYNAQRAHLEQRQIFGEKRDNKHYAADQAGP